MDGKVAFLHVDHKIVGNSNKNNNCDNINNKCPKVIWQKAASPTCHPSRTRMVRPDLDRMQHIRPWTNVTAPKMASRLVLPFLPNVTNRHTHTQTHQTDHATTSV